MKQLLIVLGVLFLISTQNSASNTAMISADTDAIKSGEYSNTQTDGVWDFDRKLEVVCGVVDKVESMVNKVKKDRRFLVGELLQINIDLQMSAFLATVLFPEILSERFNLFDKELLSNIGIAIPFLHLMFIVIQKLPVAYTSKIKNKLDSFSRLKPFIQVVKKAYSRYKKSFSTKGYASLFNDYVVLANKSLKIDNLLASVSAFGFSTLLPDSFASKLGSDQKAFLQYVCLSALAVYCVGSYLPDFIYSPIQKAFGFISEKMTVAKDTLGTFVQDFSPALYAFFLNNCVILGEDLKKLVGKDVVEKAGASLLCVAAISGAVFAFKKCTSIKLLAKATASTQSILKFASGAKALYGSLAYVCATAAAAWGLLY